MTAEATDLQVAQTILEQLGGRRFRLMTGARNFVGSAEALSFSLPSRAQDGSNKVRITLTWRDDYTIETFYIRGVEALPCSTREGVYCDNLQAVFTSITGLATRL